MADIYFAGCFWSHRSDLNARDLHVPWANQGRARNAAPDTIRRCLIFFADNDVRTHRETLEAYAQAAKGVDARQFDGGSPDLVRRLGDCGVGPFLVTVLRCDTRGLNKAESYAGRTLADAWQELV